jgi:hypothetical protein
MIVGTHPAEELVFAIAPQRRYLFFAGVAWKLARNNYVLTHLAFPK